MNYLTTICKATNNPKAFDIYWRNGVQVQGVIKVTVKNEIDDPEIIAELSAIQWLLEHRSVYGVSQAGKGLCLTVGAGAIKKLVKAAEKSSDLRQSGLGKAHLFPYARFLGTRFVGADVTVEKDDSWIKPRALNDVSELDISEPLAEIIDIKGVGRVELTAHVLQQFEKRSAAGDRQEMWRLLRQIATDGLRKVELDSASREAYQKKYGEAGDIWAHGQTKWVIVIVPGQKMPIAVTAYATKASKIGLQ